MRIFVFGCIATLACAGVIGVSACSAPGAKSGASEADETEGLQILFPTAYSAFDGVHEFKLPATVSGVKGVKWSVSDPNLVDLEPSTSGSDVMMTMKGVGQVTIFAKAGSLKSSASLTIREATADQYEAGKARYNDGVVWQKGGPNKDDPQRKLLACTNCHQGQADVEHTPTQTGGYSDQDLINIFTKGQKPDGIPQRVMPFERWHQLHQWQMTDVERDGLIVYLRALPPKSQGPVDFMGRGGGHRDGGSGHWDGGN
jgi:hypothetical protein